MFQSSLDKLWDTGAADVIGKTQNDGILTPEVKQDDIQFYINQLPERNTTMTSKDKALQLATS